MSRQTSKKSREFSSECMYGKPANKLPGIGETLGSKLQRSGYSRASDVYDQARSMNFNRNRFEGWMRDSYGANSRQSAECYEGLRNWDSQFGGSHSSKPNIRITRTTNIYLD